MLQEVAAFHVGTYARAGGEGLQRLSLGWAGERAGTASTSVEQTLGSSYPEARNASFGVYSKRFDLHYLVDEQKDGAVTVLREDASGWERLARVRTHGADPCYVALDRDERWLAVANYASGSIALFGLGRDSGIPVEPPLVCQHSGRGPHAERQEGPHAHCAIFSPDGAWLYHVDLGTDQILAFRFDGDVGLTGENRVAASLPPGSGPRHLVFHPRRALAFLVSELASCLTIFDLGQGRLSARQSLSTLPDMFRGESLGGHISLNAAGDRIYVSNRGHDSIAVFALDDAGRASLVQHVPCGGASPRFFLLLEAEQRLLVANEQGHSLTALEIARDGRLAAPSAKLPIRAPAFIFRSSERR